LIYVIKFYNTNKILNKR